MRGTYSWCIICECVKKIRRIIDQLFLNSVLKSPWAHMSISPQSGARWLQRLPSFEIFYIQKRGSKFTLELCCRKYALHPKMLQIKVVEHWILYKEISGRLCLSPPGWSYGIQRCHLLKYFNVQKPGVDSLRGWTLLKICIIQKCFKWRKLHSRGLLMFSNVSQELSVNSSAVNSSEVTNLCENGIHIRKI